VKMPYIKYDLRPKLDPHIKNLILEIKKFDEDQIEGILNYTLTKVVCESMKPSTGWRYKNLNRLMGVLSCMQKEIYRKLVVPYEERAEAVNGELKCFNHE